MYMMKMRYHWWRYNSGPVCVAWIPSPQITPTVKDACRSQHQHLDCLYQLYQSIIPISAYLVIKNIAYSKTIQKKNVRIIVWSSIRDTVSHCWIHGFRQSAKTKLAHRPFLCLGLDFWRAVWLAEELLSDGTVTSHRPWSWFQGSCSVTCPT